MNEKPPKPKRFFTAVVVLWAGVGIVIAAVAVVAYLLRGY